MPIEQRAIGDDHGPSEKGRVCETRHYDLDSVLVNASTLDQGCALSRAWLRVDMTRGAWKGFNSSLKPEPSSDESKTWVGMIGKPPDRLLVVRREREVSLRVASSGSLRRSPQLNLHPKVLWFLDSPTYGRVRMGCTEKCQMHMTVLQRP
jgi:hypothetical protein